MSHSQPQARAPRFNIRLSAELKVDAQRVTGMTRNLSTGGVCIEIDRPVAEGKVIGVTLFVVEEDVETEGARGLEVSGTVQWLAEGDRNYCGRHQVRRLDRAADGTAQRRAQSDGRAVGDVAARSNAARGAQSAARMASAMRMPSTAAETIPPA